MLGRPRLTEDTSAKDTDDLEDRGPTGSYRRLPKKILADDKDFEFLHTALEKLEQLPTYATIDVAQYVRYIRTKAVAFQDMPADEQTFDKLLLLTKEATDMESLMGTGIWWPDHHDENEDHWQNFKGKMPMLAYLQSLECSTVLHIADKSKFRDTYFGRPDVGVNLQDGDWICLTCGYYPNEKSSIYCKNKHCKKGNMPVWQCSCLQYNVVGLELLCSKCGVLNPRGFLSTATSSGSTPKLTENSIPALAHTPREVPEYLKAGECCRPWCIYWQSIYVSVILTVYSCQCNFGCLFLSV